jgi:hypothetical protein
MTIGSLELQIKKPPAVAAPQQTLAPTESVVNTNPPAIALELRGDLHEAVVVVVAAAAPAPSMTTTEDTVAAAVAGAEVTQTAMPPAMNVVATMPTTGSTRYGVPRRLPTSVTTTASAPTHLDFALCYSPRSSRLSGSASMTRSKTQYNGYGAMLYVTESLKLIPYYCLNHSSWPLSNNTEVTCRLCRVGPGKSLTS